MARQAGRAVVITGASSGIGRATAHAFAKERANLVLAARGEAALGEAARECRRIGARAVAVPTDMRDPEAVRLLAVMAAETFGGIDVWVNNAGGGVVGRYWEAPLADHRATVETDLLGRLESSYVALVNAREESCGGDATLENLHDEIAGVYLKAIYQLKRLR